ncbi:beta-galactosidase [Paenibacillus rhizovicinus]|uniref:Beta-galactosidase n=1 Tax=Paenibacillus rhizovicinus TaxID=2704463 RepID=A0A6C0P3M3_9BACL|nr:beta-galactosidase [Paenibacillus rhizovicinus]QHW33160.1 beta-galactosidase [Paenibacillus rhizovicinus]
MNHFAIEGRKFLFNGNEIQLISGAIHYFRVVPEYWRDRLLKLKACGFNTVETYLAWNVHEPKQGQFCFTGAADIVRFIEIAAELELHVIVRPSPYICAEWEFGGLPSWLLAEDGMRLRCNYQPYLDLVDAYYDTLMPLLVPLLITNGGPIIAMQVENEYGSYGNDRNYLDYLRQGMIRRGIDVLLFTSDGPEDHMLQGGSLPGTLATANFGSRPEESFGKLSEYEPNNPLVCMEYWNGWFDHWGEEHHVRGYDDVADVLDRILKSGASVNFYMFQGGTNFGFYNGANFFDKYEPTVTSYDYNALLSESGEVTPKYFAIRDVISKYADVPADLLPEPLPKTGYGVVRMTEQARLFDVLHTLSNPVESVYPETMEKLGQDYGFILYTTRVSGPRPRSKVVVQEVRDRALVYVDQAYQGVIERNSHSLSLQIGDDDIAIEVPSGGTTLSLLVENLGRVNYGWKMHDPKGITEGVRLERQFLYDWTIHPLPLDDLSGLVYQPIAAANANEGPTFYRGTFEAAELADTFLNMEGWTKGVVFINGFNLGRYWEIGPQKTLYVPAPLLRVGDNEIVVFELHGMQEASVTMQANPDLG